GITEAQARDFLGRQERAWNARRLDDYFAGFTPDAVFVDQHVTPKETIVYGRSTLAQAKAAARRFLKASTSVEASQLRAVRIAADGRSAQVLGYQVSTVTTAGRIRHVCANTEERLVLSGGAIRSRGQTDSIVNCPPPARR
ncbi:MAG: hypothetical protein ABW042_00420, partial [Phenylobacterium sp.]